MSGIFNSAIFNNAIFNTGDSTVLLGGTPAGPNVNPNAADFFDLPYHAYQREQEKVSKKEQEELVKKQEEIIALRLEAQDNLLKQKEIRARKDKQTKRQLAALEREQTRLMADIHAAMIEIGQWQLINRNNEAIIILMTAFPYLNIGGRMN